MSIPSLELQLQSLPNSPGVYQYYDKDGKILNENAERVDVFDLSEKEVSNLLSIIDNINS
jgi:hypothetical protein